MQSHLNMTTTKGGGFKDYNKRKFNNLERTNAPNFSQNYQNIFDILRKQYVNNS